MPTPSAHALLSASAAHRWMRCTAAPRFEAQFPPGTSKYAEEGTLAHKVCELKARKYFEIMSGKKFNAELDALKADPNWKDEMLRTSDVYVQYLKEKAFSFKTTPHIAFEIKVDLSEWIPEGFGTSDCAMIGDDTLHITDYKHGQGVPVSPVNNEQLMLYALGTLRHYLPVFGNQIQKVSMAIVQPRISEEVQEFALTKEALLLWGESIKPVAQTAYSGSNAAFVPGDHCRFCRGKAVCKARAEYNIALEEFKDYITPDKADPMAPDKNILTNGEIGVLLDRGQYVVDWYNDLRDYSLQALLRGEEIPGYKAVEGRSNRKLSDVDTAMDRLMGQGYDKALLYDYTPKSLTELEKLTGKKRFSEIVGDLIIKPAGKPTLVTVEDKREPYSSAVADFGGIVNDGTGNNS